MRLFIYCILICFSLHTANANNLLNKEDIIIPWNSEEGKNRLYNSNYKGDFYLLAHNYESQINPLYCGIASSVIALNSLTQREDIVSQEDLEIKLPENFNNKIISFPRYSQLTFLNEKTDNIKKRSIIEFKEENSSHKYDPGLTLTQLAKILEIYNLKISMHHANGKSINEKEFRKILIQTLNQDNNIIIANFYGKTFGAPTSGHISPIAAYDQESDSLLVLDVAAHKNPWYWINLEAFFASMNTKDGNKFRGYILASK